MIYFRPLVRSDGPCPPDASLLAGGPLWFTDALALSRDAAPRRIAASQIPAETHNRITAPRTAIAGVAMDQPRLMGILNVTPDSFSDGGQFVDPGQATAHALAMVASGADILDVGGESTRPGSDTVAAPEEIARTAPVIAAIAAATDCPISIDTRKADVAQAALNAGARIVNDVSALSFDAQLACIVSKSDAPLCLMHAQGDPKTMQDAPHYDNVLLDVYDYLAQRIEHATAAGIARERLVIDPGIGFGKTQEHNIILLRNIALFHALGCPILLGASRKRFIGVIGNAPNAADRAPGSIAITLAAAAQGVQIHRVHDVAQNRQALDLWQAMAE